MCVCVCVCVCMWRCGFGFVGIHRAHSCVVTPIMHHFLSCLTTGPTSASAWCLQCNKSSSPCNSHSQSDFQGVLGTPSLFHTEACSVRYLHGYCSRLLHMSGQSSIQLTSFVKSGNEIHVGRAKFIMGIVFPSNWLLPDHYSPV